MKTDAVKLLMLEDNAGDASLIMAVLRKAGNGFNIQIVSDRDEFIGVLDSLWPQVILSGHQLAQFNSVEALRITREKMPYVPFILVTGTVSEEFATGIIKSGADDYILKDSLARLPGAIDAASKQRTAEKAKILAEKRLMESEVHYRTMMERISDAFVAIDRNWVFTYINKKAGAILQRNPVDLIGRDAWSVFPEAIDSQIHKACFRAMSEQKDIHFEKYYMLSGIWVDHCIYPSPEGLSIFFKDVTEKKKAGQQKIFESNNLKSLINNTSDRMWSVDRQFNLITSNEAFDNGVKLMSGKSISKGDSLLSTSFTEEQVRCFKQFYERAFAGESFTEIEYADNIFDFWSEISFYPIRRGNKVIGTACYSRDITERKRADEELKVSLKANKQLAGRASAIINTIPASIALIDERGTIVNVNDTWRDLADNNVFMNSRYGIGTNYVDIIKSSQLEGRDVIHKVVEGIEAVLGHQLEGFVFEHTCQSLKANKWFRMMVSPLQGREYAGAVVMHMDISELRELEQERVQTKIAEQKMLSQAVIMGQETEKNRIGQELHDNISQLLTGSKLYLGIASHKNEMVKESIRYPLELIDSSIEEIRLLCRHLVTPVKNISLDKLVGALLTNINEVTNARTSLTYQVTGKPIPDDLKLNIYRILQEQANNILKHANAKNLTVSILAEGGTIAIAVEDDGKGFDTKKKRSGIGISNMINRIGFFDGRIDIKSSRGNGCSISMNIPY